MGWKNKLQLSDTQHKMPKRQGWSNVRDNVERMLQKLHIAFHMITDDKEWRAANPTQAIDRIFQLWESTFTPEFREDFKKIFVEKDPNYYYKNWIIRPKYLKDLEIT